MRELWPTQIGLQCSSLNDASTIRAVAVWSETDRLGANQVLVKGTALGFS
jgi:hypothetical protein